MRVLLLVGCCLLVLLQALMLRDPGKNWDRLAYYAIALEITGKSPAEAKAGAYEAVKASTAANEYERLSGSDEPGGYRSVAATDADAFSQQLGFYRSRVGYTHSLAALHLCGMPLPVAGLILSLLPALVIVALGVFELTRHASWLAFAWALALTAAVVLSRIAGIQGPDALAACLGGIGAILIFRGSLPHGSVLILCAVFFRLDYALFAICVSALATGKNNLWPILRLAIPAVLLFALIPRLSPGYDFAVQARHTFIGWINYPASETRGWGPADQLGAIARALVPFAKANWHVVLIVAALLIRWQSICRQAAGAVLLFLGLRFALFPITEQRQYAIVAILGVFVLAMGEALKPRPMPQ
jgi:hypothetical protein